MKLQSFLIAFGVVIEAHRSYCIAAKFEQVTIFVSKLRQDIPTCKKNETTWERGVREGYTGCLNVLEKFPDATYGLGKTVITTLKTLNDHLAIASNYNSTIDSKGSENTLKAISTLSKLGKSTKNLMSEFRLALPRMSSAHRNVIWTLPGIGALDYYVNKDISDLERSILKVLNQFQKRYEVRKQQRCEKIDIEQMIYNLRNLVNTISKIAETALTDCGCFTYSNDVFEALKVTAMIVYHFMISVQGTGANAATELVSESIDIPPSHNSCYQAVDAMLKAIAASILPTKADHKKWTRDVLTTFVKETKTFNRALEPILGPFKGCKVTVAEIKKNLAKSSGNRGRAYE